MSYLKDMKKQFAELKNKENIIILAIESSCDETAVAIVKNGREVLCNCVSSQIEIHRKFGGVVPEVASRNHILSISKLYHQALKEAGVAEQEIDAIAVTYGAGLMGALLVGINFAKGLAYSLNKPLIAVNHIHGHIASNYISHKELKPPFMCLMVSGGHTAILKIPEYNKQKRIGSTVDDSVGEAFDKVARVLALPYPGGPEIDKIAVKGKNNIKFTVSNALSKTLDFSFSGIKTAVVNYVHKKKQKNEEIEVENIACSFQEAVTDELVEKTIKAIKKTGLKNVVVAGGVGANSVLREKLQQQCKKNNAEVFFPVLKYCTDNAAMIASAGYYYLKDGKGLAKLDLTASPSIDL